MLVGLLPLNQCLVWTFLRVGSHVFRQITTGGKGARAVLANVRLFPGVHLHVDSERCRLGERLSTVGNRADKGTVTAVEQFVRLQIVGCVELLATDITFKWSFTCDHETFRILFDFWLI